MAQKPNFLKKLISAGLVTASTATIVAGFSGSAIAGAQKTANAPNAAFGTAANWQPAVAVADRDAVFFAPGFTTVVGAANKVTFNNNGVANTKVQMGAGQLDVAGAVGAPNQLTLQATAINTVFNLGTNGIAPANFFAPAAVGDYSGLLAIDFNGQVGAAATITTNGFNSNVNFLDSTGGGATGNITIDATGVLGGTFGANIVKNLVVTKTSDVTINSNLNIGTAIGLQGLANTAGGALSIGAGKTVTAVDIDGQNAGAGTLTFLGADGQTTTVTGTDIGANNALNQINIAGAVNFKGAGANNKISATKISLTTASSLMRFTTNDQVVTGDIVAATNGQGGIAINGVDLAVVGNIGANGNSLATINFETDQTIKISLGANASVLFVQNVNTATANTGTLALHGANFAINGNIGGNNALKLVALKAGGPAATNFTLKQNSSIKAQNISLADAEDNTLTLEDGTTVTGDIVNTKGAGNGTIVLTGNATINGGIGVDVAAGGNLGKAIKNITLGGKDLSYGGNTIKVTANPANGITFAANETLTLTNTTDPILINSNILVTTDKQGIIDASAVTNNQTLSFQNATIGAANAALGQLNIGSSKTSLSGGDVFINTLAIGNNGSVQLAHDTYLIANTTNAAGQGKIIFNPTAGPSTTLADATNLGSLANPLAEINFAGNAVVEVGKGANLYATNITTAAANTGSFSFKAGGTNIVNGTVGGQQGHKFNTVTLGNGTTAQFLGNAIFNGASTIDGNSTLQISGNYTTNFITSGDNTGIVEFVNTDPITVTLNKQNLAVGELKQITVSGPANVVVNQTGNAANNAVETDTISFENASLGASLFLPSGIPFNDAANTVSLTIKSTVGNGPVGNFNVPVVVVSGVDSVIADGQAIGDQNNIVGLGLGSDNGIIVNATTLYAGIASVNNNEGTVTLSGGIPNTPGTIYGLGIGNGTPKLKLVTFTTDYNNLGSIIATNATINDGLTVITGGIAGKDFDGTITLGSANGNSNVKFVDGTNSTSASTVATVKANNGTVTYLGSASVGNIGSSGTPVASVQFTGPAGSLEKLLGNIYSTTTNFGNVNLNVAGSKVILGGGTTAINGNINLLTNTLTFASGTSTWGAATSLATTLTVANGNIGHIVIAEGAQVNSATTGTTIINVQDNANANFSGTHTYTLIEGGARFNGTLGSPNFAVTGSNRFVNYGLIRAANQDYVITRTNNAANVVTNDIANSQFAGVPNVSQNVTTFVNATGTAAYDNLVNNAKDSANSAKFVGAIVTDTSAAVTTVNLNETKKTQDLLGNRLGALRYLGTPETAEMAGPEAGAVAAGDEAVDNVAYGIWAKPFYNVANQDKKGGVAGYKAKTTGVVIGLDTLANDNLMIGAAIGITKTDIKHQDDKKGDKTDVNGFSFSLYGAQQLVENFFAQGSAIFSLNQVKNKSQRYFFDANGNMSKQIAAGNYDNMTFGGNLTVGYDYNAMEGVLVTPMAGLSYLKSSDENYKETGTTVVNKQVNSKFSDRTDLIVGAKVAGGTMNITDLAVYPEAHAFVVHKVNGRLSKTQSVLDGQTTPFISQPDRTAKTSYNLGLSASIRPDAKMEYGIGYDFNVASKYTAHQGTLKVRVNF